MVRQKKPAKKKPAKKRVAKKKVAKKNVAKKKVARKKVARKKVAKKNVAKRTAPAPGARFVLADPMLGVGTSKAKDWRAPWGNKFDNPDFMTEFLGRLWALFGPPQSDNGEGFNYVIRDTARDVVFTAYSAGSGPSFGSDTGKPHASITALEKLVNETAPVDCHWETGSDYGPVVMGIRDDRHYFRVGTSISG